MPTQETRPASGAGPATSNQQQQGAGQARRSTMPASNDQRWSNAAARRDGSPAWYSLAGSPFTLVRRVAEDMDRIFREFGMDSAGWNTGNGKERGGRLPGWSESAAWSPAIEVDHRDGAIVVRAELPGLEQKDVNVEIDDDVLVISGERSAENRDEKGGYYLTERSYGQFFRAIPLPEGADTEHCDATFRNGVLEVTVKTPESAKHARRKVDVK